MCKCSQECDLKILKWARESGCPWNKWTYEIAEINGNTDFDNDRFEWAFVMVNSRHWHSPLQDLGAAILESRRIREDPDSAAVKEHGFVTSVDDVNTMPANQHTDEYIFVAGRGIENAGEF